MTKGIFKNTLLESGVTSKFIKVRNLRIDLANSNIVFTLDYYLDELSFEQGKKPLETNDFTLDSGFVGQFQSNANIDLELVMYNLLNTAINGTVDNN